MVVIVQGGQEVTLPLFADHVYMPGAEFTAQGTYISIHILSLVQIH